MERRIMYIVVYDLPDGLYDVVLVCGEKAVGTFRGILYRQVSEIVEKLQSKGIDWYLIHR